jgi:hypothetical protein
VHAGCKPHRPLLLRLLLLQQLATLLLGEHSSDLEARTSTQLLLLLLLWGRRKACELQGQLGALCLVQLHVVSLPAQFLH